MTNRAWSHICIRWLRLKSLSYFNRDPDILVTISKETTEHIPFDSVSLMWTLRPLLLCTCQHFHPWMQVLLLQPDGAVPVSMPPLSVSWAQLQHRLPLSNPLRILIHTQRGSVTHWHTLRKACVCVLTQTPLGGEKTHLTGSFAQSTSMQLCVRSASIYSK